MNGANLYSWKKYSSIHTLTIRNRGWVQLCSALMKVKEPYLLTGQLYDSEVKKTILL